ncbi:Fructokinase [Nymphon striatum]|nr:Fructokinase [Nymphon striatum]
MTLADKIVVLRDGLIEQYGKPMNLYEQPANKFVAGFIGSPSMNFFEAKTSKNEFSIGGKSISSKLAKTIDAVDIGIRPEHLKQCTKQKAIISGKLDVLEQLGDHQTLMILCCGEALIDMLPRKTESGEDGFFPIPGGAVFNTAIALGRLGEDTGFFSSLSTDMFGDQLTDFLNESNVDTNLCAYLANPNHACLRKAK